MCPTETESGLKQSHNVRSSSLSDTRAGEVAHSPGDALTHSRGKSKTHSSVSRHLSTRISDRPIDAFVSFYICRSNRFGRAGLRGVTICATLAHFGVLGRGLPAHIPRVNLVTPLSPA